MSPDRALEQRIHLHRRHDAPSHLARVAHVEPAAEHALWRDVLRHGRPWQRGIGGAGPHPGPPCLAAGEDGEIQSAALDLAGGEVHERLRAVAAIIHVARLLRRESQALGDEAGRVPVPPREQADDPNGIRIGQPGEAGVGGGPFDRIAHERDRLPAVVDRSGAMRHLAAADEHGSAGVEGHGAAGYESVGRTRQPASTVPSARRVV